MVSKYRDMQKTTFKIMLDHANLKGILSSNFFKM